MKDMLEVLAIKYREYKAARDRKMYQEMRNKLLKEEALHEVERALQLAKRPTLSELTSGSPTAAATTPDTKNAAAEKKLPAGLSEKERKSMEDENAMLQKLINSDLEVIKQTQNKMIEISMLIRQFSVKAFEQQQLTEISTHEI